MEMQQTMQQMLQQLLANQAEIKANQARMEADKIADRECMKQMMARTDNNRERA
jgi:hypothetical protein